MYIWQNLVKTPNLGTPSSLLKHPNFARSCQVHHDGNNLDFLGYSFFKDIFKMVAVNPLSIEENKGLKEAICQGVIWSEFT